MFFLLIITMDSNKLFAREDSLDSYQVKLSPCESRPIIDGILNDSIWYTASSISSFTQREPNEGVPASESTKVFISFDESNLYIGIRCHESDPGRIIANEMRRDAGIENDDRIEILLDTFNDGRNAFFFSTNPLGMQRDGLVRNEGENLNWDWDGIWYCETSTDASGWAAEIAIPFRTLRFTENGGGQWGMNIGRFIVRNREEAFWTPVLRNYGYLGQYKVSSFGHITGFQNITQGIGIQVKPYAAAGVEKDRNAGTSTLSNVGLDLKYSITSNLTADLSLNTDFAQVEADQEQINLTRFDLFYPEKREFFLEGAGIFWFGERFSPNYPASLLFFSRRIGLSEGGTVSIPLMGGLRMTGKIDATDLGILSVWTDKKDFQSGNGDAMHVPLTNVSVLRVRHPVFGRSNIGVIAINKQAERNNFNRTYGADWNFYVTEQAQVGGFIAGTRTSNMSGDNWAGNIDLNYMTDIVELQAQYMKIDKNFNPEVGFMPRTGIRKIYINPTVAVRPGILGIRKTYLFNENIYYHNQNGSLQTRYNLIASYTVLNNGSEVFLGVPIQTEVIEEDFYLRDETAIPSGEYSFTRVVADYYSDRSRDVSGKITGKIGKFYNGTIKTLEIGMQLKTSFHLNFEAEYQHNRIRLPIENGNFSTNLLIGRITWGLTTRIFNKLFVQWNDADKKANLNFLFNYRYLPGSDIYLVYNEQWDAGTALRSKNRTVIAKLTYTLSY